jgi:transcription antitermination factor NusG
MGISHFLPLLKEVRFYGRHKLMVETPLFPSYVFMRGTVDDVYRADRTKRVVKIIPVPDQQRLNWELQNVAAALERDAKFDPYPYLVRGARVEVRAGPLRGVQGLVDERVKPDRLILQVEMLGRALSLEVDGSLLDRID